MKKQIIIKQTLEKVIEVEVSNNECDTSEIIEIVDDAYCRDDIQLSMEDYKGDYSVSILLNEYNGNVEKYRVKTDNNECKLLKEI